MVSDVRLGSFLSGGVDSSAIVAAMKSAKRARQYVVDRFLRLELLPRAIWHLEEPIADPAAISTYLICTEARREMPMMPMMLSGIGVDELFAGYPRHLAWRLTRALGTLPDSLLRTLEHAVARPGSPGRLRGARRNLWKFMRAAGMEPLDRYLSFSSYYSEPEVREILVPAVVDAEYDPLALHRSYLLNEHGGDELSRLLYLDAKTFLPCLNLSYTDKMGMAASVEVRVPLLDDELVALAARIPSNLKLGRWQHKDIFKRSQEGILPREKSGAARPT
jgi:asparagine synthase (glutamine-hydrolysing)